MEPVQPAEILTLGSLHLLYLLLMSVPVVRWLPRTLWAWAAGLAVVAFGWSMSALLNFYAGGSGFWSWFLDPAAEKNFTALLTSLLLAGSSLTALVLWWQIRHKQVSVQQVTWGLIALIFGFLAVDEYASLHESVIFWRQGYAALGGLLLLLLLYLVIRSDNPVRGYRALFIAGLGSMGVAGVLLDAFSTQSVIDIGSVNLTFLACRGEALGVKCRDYGNTEEFLEVVGAGLMWLSLLAELRVTQTDAATGKTRRAKGWLIRSGVAAWGLVIVGWLWLAPALESRFVTPAQVNYGDVSLNAYAFSEDIIQPGDTLDVTLYAQVNQNVQRDYSMSLHLYTYPVPDVVSIAQDDMTLGEFKYPTRAWLPGVPVRNRFQLTLPDDLPTPASYRLVAMLWYDTPSNRIPAQQTDLKTLSDGAISVLGTVAALEENPPPLPDTPVYHFEEGFSLAGYKMPSEAVTGEDMTVNFWWQTDRAVQSELVHFLHLFHVETDEYVIFDQVPFNGQFPTDDWPAGMQVRDSWTVTLPDDMRTGTYRLQTGLYHVQTQERMPVTAADSSPVQNASIVLGEFSVQAAE
jgi:hypothetical protein